MKKVFRIASALVAALALLLSACSDTSSSVTPFVPFPPPPEPQPEPARVDDPSIPLTLEALADGTITLNYPPSTFKYKKNGGGFETVTPSGNPPKATIAVAAGDKVCLFANGTGNSEKGSSSEYFSIDCSADCCLYGNAMSLENADTYQTCAVLAGNYEFYGLFCNNKHVKNHDKFNIVLPAAELAEGCYSGMFNLCEGLTAAPNLPATELADFCYSSMFDSCELITSAPALPATTLADNCYQGMFSRCKGLSQGPELPATTLADDCYFQMFCECSGLKTAPVLKAKTLVYGCYRWMFYKCTSLSYVKCLATNISASNCLENWMTDVPAGGTFVKDAGIGVGTAGGWTKDSENGIPSGWTVKNAE